MKISLEKSNDTIKKIKLTKHYNESNIGNKSCNCEMCSIYRIKNTTELDRVSDFDLLNFGKSVKCRDIL